MDYQTISFVICLEARRRGANLSDAINLAKTALIKFPLLKDQDLLGLMMELDHMFEGFGLPIR